MSVFFAIVSIVIWIFYSLHWIKSPQTLSRNQMNLLLYGGVLSTVIVVLSLLKNM